MQSRTGVAPAKGMNMPTVKLSQTTVNNAKYQGSGRAAYVLWDNQLPGFGLRVQPSGRKSFILAYRFHGRQRQLALGRYGAITLKQARDLAKEKLVQIKHNEDPAALKYAERDAPIIADLADEYMAKHGARKKASSRREDQRQLDVYVLPRLGLAKVAGVTRADISKFHHQLGREHGPYQANRTLALLSKMFSLAEKWGLRSDNTNPCKHVDRFRETARERYLTEAEAARLVRALDAVERDRTVPIQAVWAVRLLMMTGARLGEILGLRWQHVDLEARVLRLPDSKTGKKEIMLSDAAAEVIRNIPRQVGNPFVIFGRDQERFVGIQRSWGKIRAAAELPDLRLHDLRHSYAAFAVAAGLSLVEIGHLLGHKQPSTTARYAHLIDSQRRVATDKVAAILDAAVKNGSKPKVVPFPKS